MNNLLIAISIANFLGLIYLIYIIYNKNKQSSINRNKDNTNISAKITLTRFNPFDDIGGDQSFILCLLDNANSGVIITSLHNRDLTRVYAKVVKDGQPQNSVLSKEEILALKKTVNN